MIVRTKKCTFLLGLIVFCFLMGGEAIAAGDGGDVPSLITGDRGIQWVNTTSVKVNLSFDGSKAICGACVIGKANTRSIQPGTSIFQTRTCSHIEKDTGTYIYPVKEKRALQSRNIFGAVRKSQLEVASL